jgi:hypothetical protein
MNLPLKKNGPTTEKLTILQRTAAFKGSGERALSGGISMAGLTRAGRRVALVVIVVLGLFAFGFDAPAQARPGPGVGSGAATSGLSAGLYASVGIYPGNGGLKYLRVDGGPCHSEGILLLPAEYKVAADLSGASVHKATRCGWVSMHWKGMGGIRHFEAELWRSATASGSINGAAYFASDSGSGYAQIYFHGTP